MDAESIISCQLRNTFLFRGSMLLVETTYRLPYSFPSHGCNQHDDPHGTRKGKGWPELLKVDESSVFWGHGVDVKNRMDQPKVTHDMTLNFLWRTYSVHTNLEGWDAGLSINIPRAIITSWNTLLLQEAGSRDWKLSLPLSFVSHMESHIQHPLASSR